MCIAITVGTGFFLMGSQTAAAVLTGAVLSGIGSGWLLARVNSIAACYKQAQKTFAVMQIGMMALAIILFLSLPRILAAYGNAAIFAVLGACPIVAIPILWRLPLFNIKLPPQARPIQRYMDEVFSRPSFQGSLTEFEQEIRQ